MKMNKLSPAQGSKQSRKRVGRGIGSGLGKTGGRGHKGQRARTGGFHKVSFEGGQTPLHRRLPKRGFTSKSSRYTAEIRLYQLAAIKGDTIDMDVLKAARMVGRDVRKVKIINTGEIDRAVTISGLSITKGAQAAVEAAGGKVE